MDWVKASWKAVVALIIPIAFGALSESVDVVATWVADNGGVWSGVAVGVLSAVGVWLKRNAPLPPA